MSIKKDILWRVNISFLGLVVVAFAIVGKAINTKTSKRTYYEKLQDSLTIRIQSIDALRGDILSEDGSLLATSLPIYDIRMDCVADPLVDSIWNNEVEALAQGLGQLFKDHTTKEYLGKLKKGRARAERFLLIQRNVSYSTLQKVKKLPLFNRGKYKGGLILVEKSRRVMPLGDMAKRTIGYIVPGVKPVGVEGAFDHLLSGTQGKRMVQRIAGGVWMPVGGQEIEPRNGADVVTTLDVNIQDIAQSALYHALDSHNADRGCVIVMEVKTGKIKAIANLGKDPVGNYTERFNYGLGESSEPGSTFKLASLMVGFEDKKFTLSDTVDIEYGAHKFGSQIMKDSKAHGYRNVSVQTVFEKSSNVGVSKLIVKHYKDNPWAFYEGLKRLGITTTLGLQIKGEEPPYIKNPASKLWNKTLSLPWMSVGYELKMSPLQVLNLYNTVANNGKMMQPLLVSSVKQLGNPVVTYTPKVLNEKIASDSTLAWARRMMEGVVLHGTADIIKPNNYTIAGKTGTAQIALGAGGYNKSDYQASFVGYFPAENPVYSCIVVIKNPRSGFYYGGLVAAPVFKEIADKIYAGVMALDPAFQPPTNDSTAVKYIIKPGNKADIEYVLTKLQYPYKSVKDAEWVKTLTSANQIGLIRNDLNTSIVPNVIGMGLKDAVYVLERTGLKVKVVGKGTVAKQSIAAGSSTKKAKEITIQLGGNI